MLCHSVCLPVILPKKPQCYEGTTNNFSINILVNKLFFGAIFLKTMTILIILSVLFYYNLRRAEGNLNV